MKLTRITLSFCCLSALSFLTGLPTFAAAPAYVDNQVRDAVRRGETPRVIIQMGDASQPKIWAPAWKQRVPAIRSLTKRVLSNVPKLQVNRTFDIYPIVAATVDQTTLDQVTRRPGGRSRLPRSPHEDQPQLQRPARWPAPGRKRRLYRRRRWRRGHRHGRGLPAPGLQHPHCQVLHRRQTRLLGLGQNRGPGREYRRLRLCRWHLPARPDGESGPDGRLHRPRPLRPLRTPRSAQLHAAGHALFQ